MNRHLLTIIAAAMTLLLLVGLGIGFSAGRYASTEEIKTITKTQSDAVIDNQVRFQQCVVAVLFIAPTDRAKLTDEKVATACEVDVTKVREIRDRLRS